MNKRFVRAVGAVLLSAGYIRAAEYMVSPSGRDEKTCPGTVSDPFRRKGYAPDLEYMVQSSADLMTWENLPAILPGYPKTVTVQDIFAPTNAPCRFLRLRISHRSAADQFPPSSTEPTKQ
jgi:hypothetical protein